MKVLASINSIPENEKLAVTIGNFDGVHHGHQFLLKEIANRCKKKQYMLVVITFVPHPRQIIVSNEPNTLINTYQERRDLLSKYRVDYLIEIDFSRDFSTLGPEIFFKKYIFSHKKIKELHFGYDFAFGAGKKGDFDFAKQYCKKKDVKVFLQEKFQMCNKTLSSTLLRDLIKQGDFVNVEQFLGRKFFIEGHVVKGVGRGKQIGFPTANVQFDEHRVFPSNGVYITRTTHNGMTYQSITNIGDNPTFKDVKDTRIETHILDFTLDIYGEKILVEFISKIRNEIKFDTVNQLVEQINSDVVEARNYKS